jgi:recombination protein RecT
MTYQNQQIQPFQPQELILSVEREFNTLAEIHKSVSFEAEKLYAVQHLTKNDFALKIAKSNPLSVQNAVRNCAAIGITLNPALKYAYLVPRDGAILLDISYMGLLHLAQDTGSVIWGQAKIVHENDTYESTGLDTAPMHRYNAFSDRGTVVGAYCTVKLAGGDYLTHEMGIASIYKIRDRSQSWKSGKASPWRTDEGEMIKKTVVKQASKYWPKVERLQQAADYLHTEAGEGIEFEKEVNPNRVQIQFVSDDQLIKIKEAMEFVGVDEAAFCAKAGIVNIDQLPVQRFEGAMKWLSSIADKQAKGQEVSE